MKVTPANNHDSSVAMDLVAQCCTNTHHKIEYFLMDSGYDHREIYSLIKRKILCPSYHRFQISEGLNSQRPGLIGMEPHLLCWVQDGILGFIQGGK